MQKIFVLAVFFLSLLYFNIAAAQENEVEVINPVDIDQTLEQIKNEFNQSNKINNDFALPAEDDGLSKWNSSGAKKANIDQFINSIKANYPGIDNDNIKNIIGNCYLFEENIKQCEPNQCIMLHPILSIYNNNIKIKKSVIKKEDGKCIYKESTINGGILSCKLDSEGIEFFAKNNVDLLKSGMSSSYNYTSINMADKVISEQCSFIWNDKEIEEIRDEKDSLISFPITKVPDKLDNKKQSPILSDDKGELSEDDDSMTPVEKELTYRTQIIPQEFATKFRSYRTRDNKHLPVYTFYSDYEANFFKAAKEGDVNGLRSILNLGNLDINIQDNDKNTALHYAAFNKETNAIQYLIMRGADINIVNNQGNTIAHIAAETNNPELINILKKHNVDFNIKNEKLETPIMLALHNKSSEAFDKLLHIISKKGKNLTELKQELFTETVKAGDIDGTKFLSANEYNPNYTDKNGNNLLHIAVINGYTEIAEILIAAGADIDAKNKAGHTPKQIADKKGFTDIADIIETQIIKRSFNNDITDMKVY